MFMERRKYFNHLQINLQSFMNSRLPRWLRGKEPTCQCWRHETRVWPLCQEDPLEEDIATHSSILAWESHGQMSLVGPSPWCCRVRDDWVQAHTHTHKKFQFTLEGEIAKLILNHMEKPRSNNCQEYFRQKSWVGELI